MAEEPVKVVVQTYGRGGVPTIPPKVLGKPGLQECAREVTGPLYDYLPKSMTQAAIQEGHNPGKKRQPSPAKVEAAFREVYDNPPSTLQPGQSKEQRRQQMAAIAFSKARKGK